MGRIKIRCKNCKRTLGEQKETHVTYQGEEFYCKRFKCLSQVERGQVRRLNWYQRNEPLRKKKVIRSVKNWLYGNKRRTAELKRTIRMRKIIKHHPKKRLIYSQDFVAVRWE